MPDWDLVLTAESMRALEIAATQTPYQIALDQLMERAGHGVAETFRSACPSELPVLILVGPGNNGGDALVAARYLLQSGYRLACYMFCEAGKSRSDLNELNLQRLKSAGSVEFWSSVDDFNARISKFQGSTGFNLIDGFYGLGFRGELPETVLEIMRLCKNQNPKFKLAIDLPSGLPYDGMAHHSDLNALISADVSVSFAFRKLPHVLSPFRHLCGEVKLVDIGIPKELSSKFSREQVPQIFYCNLQSQTFRTPFSTLSEDSHKYERGHVLVIGGSPGLSGAPILASLAALRAGAGWVSLALPKECRGEKSVPLDVPMADGIFAYQDGKSRIDVEQLAHFVEHKKVKSIVIGCGFLGTKPLPVPLLSYLRDFIRIYNGYVILDAGALVLAETWLEHFKADGSLPRRLLLLPHPGEWQRMFQHSRPGDFNNAEAFLKVAAWLKSYQLSLIYKSASPVFVEPESSDVYIHKYGSRVLAKAGSGDVLAGICGALSCRISNPLELAQSALTLLGSAAEAVVHRYGFDGSLTTDLIEAVGSIQAVSPENE